VSDFTRDAMQSLVNRSTDQEALAAWMNEFRAHMSNLDRKIEQLSERIGPLKELEVER